MNVRRSRWVMVLVGLWLAAVVFGLTLMTRYATTPGSDPDAPLRWPANSQIERSDAYPTLVMFVHPLCFCSRASLSELGVLVAECRGRVHPVVMVLDLDGLPDPVTKAPIWRAAAEIPGVTVRSDRQGVEASRFHGATSGRTLLYDTAGRLLFAGGITASRGHIGENAGRRSLQSLLTGSVPERSRTPVFGCGLFSPGARVSAEP